MFQFKHPRSGSRISRFSLDVNGVLRNLHEVTVRRINSVVEYDVKFDEQVVNSERTLESRRCIVRKAKSMAMMPPEAELRCLEDGTFALFYRNEKYDPSKDYQ
jgi:hypothetical protein